MSIGDKDIIRQCVTLIKEADCILIGAGAGMSAAAGIDYTDSERFKRLFPRMFEKGFRNNYQLMGFRGLSDAAMWGYHAMHVQHVGYDMQEHPVYQGLLSLVQNKNYFVITSNVDRMFYKNHFQEESIFTPQGSYALIQCMKPCSNETWDIRPYLDRLLSSIDAHTHEINDVSAIPACPKCGGEMFMNVRGGSWFVENPYEKQREKFSNWVNNSLSKKLLVMEFGSGFNTPSVIRYPLERITHLHPSANMIRVNQDYAEVPGEIELKSISIKGNIKEFIYAIKDE